MNSGNMTPVQRADLRKWRFMSPGCIAGLSVAPMAWQLGIFQLNEKLVWSLLVPAFGVVVSFLYEILDIRGPLWREEMERYVGKQIKDFITDMIPPDLHVTDTELLKLREEKIMRRLTGIFWETVDSDDQLSSHKEAFYNIGKYYSSAFDIFIICGLIGYAYYFTIYSLGFLFSAAAGAAFLAIALCAWYQLIPICRERMLAISREQLEQLRRRQLGTVQAQIRESILEIRRLPSA